LSRDSTDRRTSHPSPVPTPVAHSSGCFICSLLPLAFLPPRLALVAPAGLRPSRIAENAFISVPVEAIARVCQSYLSNPQTISVYFDRKTLLGRKVAFVPCGRARLFSKHPTTEALEQLMAPVHRVTPNTEVSGTPWANNPDFTYDEKKPSS
jgi:hypothetical protein